jgi:hypothetical protein
VCNALRECSQCIDRLQLLCCIFCYCLGGAAGGSRSSLEGQSCDHPSPASLLIHQLLHIRANTETATADAARHDGLCARLDGWRNSRAGGLLGGESAHGAIWRRMTAEAQHRKQALHRYGAEHEVRSILWQ